MQAGRKAQDGQRFGSDPRRFGNALPARVRSGAVQKVGALTGREPNSVQDVQLQLCLLPAGEHDANEP